MGRPFFSVFDCITASDSIKYGKGLAPSQLLFLLADSPMQPRVTARRAFIAFSLVLVGACTSFIAAPAPTPVAAPPTLLVIRHHADGSRSVDIRVMSFNVAGLPQPIRRTRDDALALIGDELMRLRKAGEAPHVLLIQEGFTDAGEAIGRRAGYAFASHGPRSEDAATIDAKPMPARFVKGQRWLKGEGLGKLLGSGLHIYSDFPILSEAATAFGADACAGTDCLARKGIVSSRLRIAGLPEPLEIANTHLNSFRDAGKPYSYSLAAFARQSETLARFVGGPGPLILAGDFNAAEQAERITALDGRLRLVNALDDCRQPACNLPMDLRQRPAAAASLDQHYVRSGASLRIVPVAVRWRFDRPVRGAMLSDHKALEVTYRLTWTPPLQIASLD
jgi:Endonuclease/Exonuclease/phosphatase family